MSNRIIFRKKYAVALGLVLAGYFLLASPVSAALSLWGDETSGLRVGFEAFQAIGMGNRDPRVIIAGVVQVILGFLGVLSIVLIMYGGFVWMTAGGDTDKVQRAKDILKNAVIGLLIILSAFAIATFVLRALIGSIGGDGTAYFGNGDSRGALSAMGSGIIRSVYPTPNQREVPRNTTIIVSFKEPMEPSTICNNVAAGKCVVGAKIIPDSIKIFKTNDADNKATNLTEVGVASADNKTFIFTPLQYLGTPSDKLWYTVALTPKIKKANKNNAFSVNGFAWQFEVSNILDLTPPQVLKAGVFPTPDNDQDQAGDIVEAKQATASISVNGLVRTARSWSVSFTKSSGSDDLIIAKPKDNTCDGKIMLAINNTTPKTANLAYRNMNGFNDEPEAAIIDKKIKTACGFDITVPDRIVAGNSWELNLVTARNADNIIIGKVNYQFVDKVTATNQILVGATTAQTATNIVTALTNHPQVTAVASGPRVNLTTKAGGRSLNSLDLLTSASQDALSLTAFSGGTDRVVTVKIVGKADKPKNATIQINFNEAINPLVASGRSEDLKKYIRIVNLTDGSTVSGEFILSNQYRTIEFRSDLECGVNGCGEKIYCLPGNANLQVELSAAALAASCQADTDCQAKTPFVTCQTGLCYDQAGQAYYPEGQPGTGIFDLANNSLDGNRDTKALGPVAYYKENDGSGSGDNFQWSFWISDILDLTAPSITEIKPAYSEAKVDLNQPITVKFNKLMLSSSLNTGSLLVKKGNREVEHQMINLRSLAKTPVGYWVEKLDEENSQPPDNEADLTSIAILHSPFVGSNSYRAQIGSGIKDIYQNCYKPSAGPSCAADSNLSSCCNGTATDLGSAQTCP